MDAHRGLTEQEADNALRELFRASGTAHGPAGMEARIMQRIAVAPRVALRREPALIPTWVWFVTGAFVLAIALLSYAAPRATSDHGFVRQVLSVLPKNTLHAMISSPWLLMGVISLSFLLVLDLMLTRSRAVIPQDQRIR